MAFYVDAVMPVYIYIYIYINVKVIDGEECVSQHLLLVGDVVISSAPRKKKRMHIPRLKVWKLRQPNVKQEFAWLVTDRKDEVFEADNVE